MVSDARKKAWAAALRVASPSQSYTLALFLMERGQRRYWLLFWLDGRRLNFQLKRDYHGDDINKPFLAPLAFSALPEQERARLIALSITRNNANGDSS